MEITYIAHSSFVLKDTKGRTVVTDPYTPDIGYKPYTGTADIVTISHHHPDHDYIDEIKGNPKILDKVGFFNEADIPIKGILSYHDNASGSLRGVNIIYVFEMEGYKICHLGDLGTSITEKLIAEIGNIDVLMIPVGGNYTLDGKEAAQVCKLIKSPIVIPMHYKTPYIDFPISGVEDFISNMKTGKKLNSNTLMLQEKPISTNEVLIFDISN